MISMPPIMPLQESAGRAFSKFEFLGISCMEWKSDWDSITKYIFLMSIDLR